MNTKNFSLALASVIAFASIAALAMGFDLQTILASHADTASGLAMLGAGSMDLLTKSLDKIEDNLDGIKTRQTEFADRLLMVEQSGGGKFAGEHSGKAAGGLGDQFIKAFNANRELFDKTRSVRLELKAAGDTIGTSSGRNIISGGVGAVRRGRAGPAERAGVSTLAWRVVGRVFALHRAARRRNRASVRRRGKGGGPARSHPGHAVRPDGRGLLENVAAGLE